MIGPFRHLWLQFKFHFLRTDSNSNPQTFLWFWFRCQAWSIRIWITLIPTRALIVGRPPWHYPATPCLAARTLLKPMICCGMSFRQTSAEGVLSSSQFIRDDLPLPAIMMDIEWKSWGDIPFIPASPPGKTNCRALMNGIKEENFQIKEKPQSLLILYRRLP